MATKTLTVDCWKCGGTGLIEAFSHIANGDCFACKGTGKLTGKAPTARKARPQKPVKQEVEPCKWELPPEPGLRSIFSSLNGVYARLNGDELIPWYKPETLAYYGDDKNEVLARIDRYNLGERWYQPQTAAIRQAVLDRM